MVEDERENLPQNQKLALGVWSMGLCTQSFGNTLWMIADICRYFVYYLHFGSTIIHFIAIFLIISLLHVILDLLKEYKIEEKEEILWPIMIIKQNIWFNCLAQDQAWL